MLGVVVVAVVVVVVVLVDVDASRPAVRADPALLETPVDCWRTDCRSSEVVDVATVVSELVVVVVAVLQAAPLS